MTRKEKIADLENYIRLMEMRLNFDLKKDKPYKEFDAKVTALEKAKADLKKLLYTEEEIRYQNLLGDIINSEDAIDNLETSLSKMSPKNELDFDDYSRKSLLLREYHDIYKKAKMEVEKDYENKPLYTTVKDIDEKYCEATFMYGSDAQKRAVNQIIELKLMEEYGSNSEYFNNNGDYIKPYYVDENGNKVNYDSGITGGMLIPKGISYNVLSELISIPESKMMVGTKEMVNNIDYDELIEALGMNTNDNQTLEVYVELANPETTEWQLSFVYGCREVEKKVFDAFETKYIPGLGANSTVKREFDDCIKPTLTLSGGEGIAYVMVPDFLLHIMVKHLVNDEAVKVYMGSHIFEEKFNFETNMQELIDAKNEIIEHKKK